MRERRTLMKRLLASVLVVVMIFTSQNLSGIVSAMADEGETLVQSEVMTYVSDVELPSNDELFAGYVDKEFYGETSTYGWLAGNRLQNVVAYNLYNFLMTEIEAIADGTSESTVITFDPESLGAEATFENMSSDEAWAEFIAQFDMSLVFDALLHDCPYELYWFDKTTGMSYGSSMSMTGSAPTYTTVTIVDPYITFAVAGNYQSASYDSSAPTVDTALTSATSTAVTNAKAIVTANESLDDYSKLKAYKDKICELVSYDTAAANAGTFSQDNDPWQLIHVFDGDTDTNVVCEGYSKAFQYLCDMSTFEYSSICSYIVTGTMAGGTGSGGHMWNIVTMEDDCIYPTNYLVDVTNSDAGSIGQNGGLFLAGTAGDIANGYTFTVSGSEIKFTYDSDTTGLWGTDTDSILILADSDYVYTPTLDSLRIGEVNVVVDGVYDSTAALPSGVSYDHSTNTITLNNANLELGLEISDSLIEAKGDYTLVLTGDNTITPVSSNASLEEDYVRGINILGDLTISGTGSLTIDVSGINVLNEAYGIRVDDNMVINGGTINVVTGDVSDNGIYNKAIEVSGNLTINAGTLNAVVGNALGTDEGYAYGIEVYKNMTVAEGAIVNATAGDATSYSWGLLVSEKLTSSGDITVGSGAAAGLSAGLYANTMDTNGGKVVATAGESDYSYGIEGNDITINDAYIEAQSGSRDICEYISLDIEDSIIVSKGQKTVAVYGEVTLADDLAITSEYTFEYDNDATLSLGEYSIIFANGGTISDEALAGMTDEAVMVTLADGTNIYYSDIQTALTKAMDNTGSVLTLLSDVDEQIFIENGEFTIDLNGYGIVTTIDEDYAVVIYNNAKATIKDSSEAKSGIISNIGENQTGFGIYVTDATLILDGVTCKGGTNGINNYSGGNLYVNDSIIEGSAYRVSNSEGNLYISGSSVVDIDISWGGTTYISGALTDDAAITFNSYDATFDVAAKAADGYTITESDLDKFIYNGPVAYTLGINSDGDIQEFGNLAFVSLAINPNNLDYSGTEQSVIETVMFDGTTLTKDTDYTVEGASGTDVDEYTVTIKGKGNYIGTLTEVFYINAATLTVYEVTVDTKVYDGTNTAAVSEVIFNGLKATDVLTEGIDYTITASFTDANAGTGKNVTYTITLLDTAVAKNYAFAGGARTYTGAATGTIEKAAAPTLNIEEQSAEYGSENLIFDIADHMTGIPSDAGVAEYAIGGMMPIGWSVDVNGILTITQLTTFAGLTASIDIVVSTENYEDATVRFTVESKARDVSDVAEVTLSDTEFEYNGSEQTPTITVAVNGTILTDGTDYDFTYPSDTITAGDKEVSITFKGNYTGKSTATYEITKKVISPIVTIKDKQYDGEVDAEIESITLNGVVTDDDVSVTWNNVVAEFSDAFEEADKSVTLTGEPTLTGTDAGNYQVDMENVSVTGNICNNYEAVEGVDYTINADGWTNENIVITAMNGYEIAPVGVTMGEWVDEFVVGVEGQYTITFLVRNSEGHISKTVSIAAKIDKTAPTGRISIINSEFTSLNTIGGFKLFFGGLTYASITGADNNGVQSIEYILSEEYLDKLELLTRTDWAAYSAIELVSPSAQYIYAKITDVADNYTYISSTGVVVYSNIEADTISYTYTKKSDTAVDVNVQLNGNTIDKLWLETDGVLTEVVADQYEVSGNIVTIKNTYLDELEEGFYIFGVSCNPLGYEYVDGEDNVEPAKLMFDITVELATGNVSIINEDKLESTFGEDFASVQYDTNSSGEVIVEYKAQGEDDSLYSTEKPVNAGDYTVRVTVKANDYYTEAVATADFTIEKAESVADVETNELPKESNEVSNDVEKLSDVKLPEGWVWSEEYSDITLEPGKEVTATAVYVGEDKDNYENTTMTVKVTRAVKVVVEKPSTDDKTEENPYTGDTRNTMVWLYVLILSGLAAVVAGKKRRSAE